MYFPYQKSKANGKRYDAMSDEELFKCAGANLLEQAPDLCRCVHFITSYYST